MRVLVLGGIRSGKSHWAEATISDTAGEPVRYVATGRTDPHRPGLVPARGHPPQPPAGALVDRRNHRCGNRIARRPAHPPTLVDDIGGWLTATMDRLDAWTGGSVRTDVDALCAAVTGFDGKLTLVSPRWGLTVVPATAGGRLFTDELGTLNQRLAALCDRVVLVVAGQPLVVKEAR